MVSRQPSFSNSNNHFGSLKYQDARTFTIPVGTQLFINNKTLWERILGPRCIRHIRMYISWKSACTSVQGLMIGSTEYGDSLVCR